MKRTGLVYGEGRLLNSLVHISLVHLNTFPSRFSCSSLTKVWSRPGFPVRLGQENRSRGRFHYTSGTCTKRPPRASSVYASAAYRLGPFQIQFSVHTSRETCLPALFQREAYANSSPYVTFLAHCSSVHRPCPVDRLLKPNGIIHNRQSGKMPCGADDRRYDFFSSRMKASSVNQSSSIKSRTLPCRSSSGIA